MSGGSINTGKEDFIVLFLRRRSREWQRQEKGKGKTGARARARKPGLAGERLVEEPSVQVVVCDQHGPEMSNIHLFGNNQ